MFSFTSYKRNYINFDVKNLTLRFRLTGKGAALVSRQTFFVAVEKTGITDVLGFWKAEDPYECFVSFGSKESADFLKNIQVFRVNQDVEAFVTDEDDTIQEIKFMWVPMYISNELFEEYLHLEGFRILSENIIKDSVDGKPNGTRAFKIIGNKTKMRNLPHLINFSSYGFQSLLRVPGREPLCLKCKGFGHLRFNCPVGRRPQQQPNDNRDGGIIDRTKSTWGQAQKSRYPEQDAASTCSDSGKEDDAGEDDGAGEGGGVGKGAARTPAGGDDSFGERDLSISSASETDKDNVNEHVESKVKDNNTVGDGSQPTKDSVENVEREKDDEGDDYPPSTNPCNQKEKRKDKKDKVADSKSKSSKASTSTLSSTRTKSKQK